MNLNKKGNNPFFAASYLVKGLSLLTRPELRRFLLIPILINVLLYSIALGLAYFYMTDLINQFIPDWLSWLTWILWPLFFVTFFVAGFFTFTIIANLFAAPFYCKLAAKALTLTTGKDVDIQDQPVMKVVGAELRRIAYLMLRAIPLLILFVIPGLNVIAPFAWALFGAWGMALEYMAYPLENDGVLFEEQKELVKSVRLGALGFGGLTMAGLTIPVLNIIIAPAAVIGATLYFNEIKLAE